MKKTRRITLLLAVAVAMVFVGALVAQVSAADTASTITGKVTKAGTLETDSGEAYKLIGDNASELTKNIGMMAEVKGTVMDKSGEMSIEVESFKLIEEPSTEKSEK